MDRTPEPSSPLLSRAAALLLGLAVVGCSWSVPADPGENARLRGSAGESAPAPRAPEREAAVATREDEGARALYLERCGRCHAPFPPTHAPASAWPSLVRHYGPRAGLFGEDQERVTRWLQAASR